MSSVRGLEPHEVLVPLEIFDGRLLADTRNHDLPSARLRRLMHGEQIAIDDVRVLHAVSPHPQQEARPRSEQRGIDAHVILDVLLGEDRRAGSDAPEQGQAGWRYAGKSGFGSASGCITQTDPTRDS